MAADVKSAPAGVTADAKSADAKSAPAKVEPFVLANGGLMCHFNALLQALVSCPAIARVVQAHNAYFSKTPTGVAFAAFVISAAKGRVSPAASGILLDVLVAALKKRRPDFEFSATAQESASEGLVLLLDMIAPEGSAACPLAALLTHRYACSMRCTACGVTISAAPSSTAGVSTGTSTNVIFDLCHHTAPALPATPAAFAESMRKFTQPTDYKCATCGRDDVVDRQYELRYVPEIVICFFNIYESRPVRFIPAELRFPGSDGSKAKLCRAGVAQVVHAGALSRGHYTTVARRADGDFYLFNDNAAPVKSAWATKAADVYLAVYTAGAVLGSSV